MDPCMSHQNENENDDDSKQEELIYTFNAQNAENKDDILRIPIKIEDAHSHFKLQFTIAALYSNEEKMQHLFDAIKQRLACQIEVIRDGSFTGYVSGPEDKIATTSITEYARQAIMEKGLHVYVRIKYEHKIKGNAITCPFVSAGKACPIYDEVREKESYKEEYYRHLIECTHFEDEFGEKPECKDEGECENLKRMEKGGNRLDDRCHMALFRHPPRMRSEKLAENVKAFIMKEDEQQTHDAYQPDDADKEKYAYNESDGYLWALIEEVVKNGFKSDLCLLCGPDDDCKHDANSILQVVEQKLNHIRHKKIGSPLRKDHMLALVLYTGCECNIDLCQSQRDDDYDKWKWFDYCLLNAIRVLNARERGAFPVYTGLNGVHMPKASVKEGYFVTYVSTSWSKQVAEQFAGGQDGMIIQLDETYKNGPYVKCCDVSWISKFPDECEILFARSRSSIFDAFQCEVVDESNGIQTVVLKEE